VPSGRRVAVKRMIISRQTNIAALENEIAMMVLNLLALLGAKDKY